MSSIKVDRIAPSAGGTEFSLTRGVAKAWLEVDGTGTASISDSLNVSSITDVGVGNYDFDLTASMASDAYAVAIDAVDMSNGSQSFSKSAKTASNNRLYSYAGSNSFGDSSAASGMIMGDLA